MAKITAQMVKELREKTGAGMMDCKKALQEAEGNIEKAIEILRKKGIAAAQKRAGRTASEGMIGSYIHMGGKIGVLVEVNCETDFVARNETFKELVNNIAMQIAASSPKYVKPEDIPTEVIEKEKEIYIEQAKAQGKPDNIAQKIAEGRIKKFYSEVCLLNQPYIRDDKKTVQDILTEAIAKIGENIQVRRFVRYQLGEGLEKRQDNLAEEVKKAIEG